MQLQRVVASDLDDLLPLVQDYCRFNGVRRSDEDLLMISRVLIADPDREGLQIIARDAHDHPIGFATVVWTWATWAGGRVGTMGDLFVVAPARRAGCARALIAACLEECRRVGARGLIWTTAKDNTAARALYESLGTSTREWVDYWLDT